jgi:hypothetical protein
MMAALVERARTTPDPTLSTYGREFTTWRIGTALAFTGRTRNYCAYAEGLASALTLMRGNVEAALWDDLKRELDTRNRNHLALQLTDHDRVRVLSEAGTLAFRELANGARARGGFLTGDSEPTQRIDFTQHCITGYMHTLGIQ